jgi:hypothetical protein
MLLAYNIVRRNEWEIVVASAGTMNSVLGDVFTVVTMIHITEDIYHCCSLA